MRAELNFKQRHPVEQMEKFVGQYYRYPDTTGSRQAEGGRRIRVSVPQTSSGSPLVTIITVCKNSSNTLKQTIQSVIDQTYRSIEYIIVDGMSSDRTIDIVKEFENALEYYISEPDTGIYDAMNKGLKLAQGEYVIIVNSDDWFERNAISSLVSAMQYTDCDFVGALARYISEDGQSFLLPSMAYNKSTLLRMPVRHETLLIPSHVYEQLGPYSDEYKIIADYEFCIRLYNNGKRYYEVPEHLLNFRTSGVSNTDVRTLQSEHSDLLRRIFPFLAAADAFRLGNHSIARPHDFVRVSYKHLDQYAFVLAVREMLEDYRKVWGGTWSHGPLGYATNRVSYIYPEVSVILPLNEEASSLEETIRSLLNQDLYDIEIICVAYKACSDRRRVASRLSQGDRRIRILEATTEDGGSGAAQNAGIRAARGKYIFSFDHRHRLGDDCLVNFHQAATDTQSDVVFGVFADENDSKSKHTGTGYRRLRGAAPVLSNVTVDRFAGSMESLQRVWGSFCRRDLAETILYPEKLGAASTSVFLLRAFCSANLVSVVEESSNAGPVRTGDHSQLSLRDCLDELSCRNMIGGVLRAAGHLKLAAKFLVSDWKPKALRDLKTSFSEDERRQFYHQLSNILQRAGLPQINPED